MNCQIGFENRHQGSATQVVFVPAKFLLIFRDIALDATGAHGAWWGIDPHEKTLVGPYFRERDIAHFEHHDFTAGPWGELVDACRQLPVWVLNAAESASYGADRTVILPAELVCRLLAPITHAYWCRWRTGSPYARALVSSTHALLGCTMVQREPLRVERVEVLP